MRATLICATVLTLCMNNLAFAGHHNRHFTIAVNVPNSAPDYVVEHTDTYIVSNEPRHRHHREPHWVDMTEGQPLPDDIVAGGDQPDPRFTLYVCRASYNGGVHPGKLIAGKCNIGWGGDEISLSQYQVLVSRQSLGWVSASFGSVPQNAVNGGYQHDQQLYICQAEYMGGMHPGKVVGNACNIGWGGREISINYYNVLVG